MSWVAFDLLAHDPANTPLRPITPHARRPPRAATCGRVDPHRRLRRRRRDFDRDRLTRRLSVNDCGQRVGHRRTALRARAIPMPSASARTRPFARSLSRGVALATRFLRTKPCDHAAALHTSFVRPGRPKDLPRHCRACSAQKKIPPIGAGECGTVSLTVESTRLSRQTRRLTVPRLFLLLSLLAIRRRCIFIIEVRNPGTESRQPTMMLDNQRLVIERLE